jgi:hypothetical protein
VRPQKSSFHPHLKGKAMNIGDFHRKQYDAETQRVALLARSLRKENPGFFSSHGEAIEAAEQIIAKENLQTWSTTGGCDGR